MGLDLVGAQGVGIEGDFINGTDERVLAGVGIAADGERGAEIGDIAAVAEVVLGGHLAVQIQGGRGERRVIDSDQVAPLADDIGAAGDVEDCSLRFTARRAVEHAEAVARTVGVGRLVGGGALEEVPAGPVAAAIVELVVERGLGVAEVAFHGRFQPGLDTE